MNCSMGSKAFKQYCMTKEELFSATDSRGFRACTEKKYTDMLNEFVQYLKLIFMVLLFRFTYVKTTLTCLGMDYTRPLKVSCSI